MPGTQIREIQDEELRGLMEKADALLGGGDDSGCVHVCADAYLLLLQKQPQVLTGLQKVLATPRVQAGLETGTLRFAPLMWPRLAAKLSLPDDGPPAITFDREQISFSETVQYYEFTLNLIADAEKGTLQSGEGGTGL
ncbi:MAG: hypothetical protein AB7R89_00720 [Dehalococcoidia bacterium]